MIRSAHCAYTRRCKAATNVLPALLRATAIAANARRRRARRRNCSTGSCEDEPERAPEILAARARMLRRGRRSTARDRRARSGRQRSIRIAWSCATRSRPSTRKQGKVGAALRELTGLVNARPDDPAALNALGYTLADHSRELARARKLIERAHAAAPRNAAILDSLGLGAVPPGPSCGSGRPICGPPTRMIAAATLRLIWAKCCGGSAKPPMPNKSGPKPAPSMPTIACSRRRVHAFPWPDAGKELKCTVRAR